MTILLLFDIELVLGFGPTEYEVHENNKSVTVEVFIQGILGDYQLIVFMSTMGQQQLRSDLSNSLHCSCSTE